MTENPIPELQVGDVVEVADSGMACCEHPRDDGYGNLGCCGCPIEIDTSYQALVEDEQDIQGWLHCREITRITRRVVVDGEEKEVTIWER